MQCILAVDGGNTKTIALDGTVLGIGRGGCSDMYNAAPAGGAADSAAAALANAEHAVRLALHAAGVSPAEIAVGVFNMAGADWPEDIQFWRDAMRERGMGREIIAQNDALGVLYAASPEATGVSIVAGTGVATGARAPDGRVWHSSFWQDEAQGIGPPTSLTARVLAFLDAHSVEAVLHLFNNRHQPAPVKVDRLAPILLDEAHAGDMVALRVVREHGAALGDFALAARQVGLDGTAYPLVLAVASSATQPRRWKRPSSRVCAPPRPRFVRFAAGRSRSSASW
ncbi:MAG TPA: BadF/BadG/BcrA/BcrD ATPase family protein [Ktedonobacterales bacterium]|nr:BadF/BadG/BcrA/BcrD ATPase family protein [Ktedonobacterales bacterium]